MLFSQVLLLDMAEQFSTGTKLMDDLMMNIMTGVNCEACVGMLLVSKKLHARLRSPEFME